MKLSARLSAAAIIAGATVLIVATPAVASAWVEPQVIGGTEWGLRSSTASIGHTYDEANNLDTTVHRFGALYIDNWVAWCDETTADVQTDAGTGDVVITCDAQESDITGLFVTPNFRLYSTGDLARMYFTIENRTGAAIDATDFYLYDNYDESDVILSSSGSTASTPPAGDTWAIVSGLSATTVAGSYWSVGGGSSTSTTGDIVDDSELYHNFANKTFPPNSTTYVADFITTHLPAAPFDAAAQTAAFSVASSAASEFDSFSGRLVAGLPADITVLNWGPTAAAVVPPALAATGTDGLAVAAFAGGAIALVLGGVGLMVSRRRRAA